MLSIIVRTFPTGQGEGDVALTAWRHIDFRIILQQQFGHSQMTLPVEQVINM